MKTFSSRSLAFAALIAGFVVGCGPQAENAAPSPSGDKKPLKIAVVYDAGGRGDKSFNDSAWAGIERAKNDFGVVPAEVQSKANKDFEPNLIAMAEAGNDLVIAVGITQQSALEKVAKEFPDVKFAIVDSDDLGAPNVRALLFKEEQGSFLVGYLAGLMAKSGKVGFVGGMEIDLIKRFEYGFYAGAKTANPSVTPLASKYTGNWDDQGKGKDLAALLFSQGADVVFAAAGRAGLGTIKAAKDAKKFAIGVDSDQDYLEPGVILTSMVKRVDTAVYATIKDLTEGKFAAGKQVYGLESDGVGISELKYTKDLIGEANLAQLEKVRQQVISGEITVPKTADEYAAFKPK